MRGRCPVTFPIGAAVSRARSRGDVYTASTPSSSPMRAAVRSACCWPVSARWRPGARPGSTLPVELVWP